MNTASYRSMEPGEEEAVSRLVLESFQEFVGHEFPPEGVAEFERFVQPDALQEALDGRRIIVALVDGALVGVVRLRRAFDHINLLFVDKRFHRRGIAGSLVDRAIARAVEERPDLVRITVNSSRYAVPMYERLNFRKTGDEQAVNGIISIPMALELDRSDGM